MTEASKKPKTAKTVKPTPMEAEILGESETDSPGVPFMPPNILLLFIMGGIALDWLFPVNFGHWWGAFGLLMLAGAVGVAFWCRKLFENAGTNVRPDQPSTAIVESGPFRYSRNPIYVSFLFAYAGLAMLADAPVMLLLTAALWYVLDTQIVKREEAYLEEKFGAAYADYQARTRRWL